jgi:hypothetical protein
VNSAGVISTVSNKWEWHDNKTTLGLNSQDHTLDQLSNKEMIFVDHSAGHFQGTSQESDSKYVYEKE